jgi:hypothetical protein
MAIRADWNVRIAIHQQRFAVRAVDILFVDGAVTFAAACGNLVPRLHWIAYCMASMTVNADGSVQVSGRQYPRMIAVEFFSELLGMTGLTIFAAFYLEFAMITGNILRMWILPDAAMAIRTMQRIMN